MTEHLGGSLARQVIIQLRDKLLSQSIGTLVAVIDCCLVEASASFATHR